MSKPNKRARVKAAKGGEKREKRETENVGMGVNTKRSYPVMVTVPGMLLFILSILAIEYSPDNGDAERTVVGVTQLIVKDGISLFLRSPLETLVFAVRSIHAYVTIENLVIAAFLLNVGMGIVANSVEK